MKYENWISYRYLIASKGRFLKFLNIVSIAGVAIGVAALIIVMSVMTGFGNNLREKIIGTLPHIMIQRESGIENYMQTIERVRKVEGVAGAAPFIQGSIFLENEGQAVGLAVRGIDPNLEGQVTKVETYLKQGKLSDLDDKSIVVGKELARYYGFKLGDSLTLIAPNAGISGKSWRYTFNIVGIFNTGMADYDLNLVLINLTKAQEIFGFAANTSMGVGVKLTNPYHSQEIKEKMFTLLGPQYSLRTWIDINRSLFEALFLEKWGLFLILTMMVLVASFNIISTLIVTVTSKVHDIGILQAIGVPKKMIRKIFTKQGIYIGMLGTLWGTGFGLGVCYVLRHFIRVPAEIYSIDHVPVEIQPFDIGAIVAASLLITYLATIYPAIKASKLEPVEALRYE